MLLDDVAGQYKVNWSTFTCFNCWYNVMKNNKKKKDSAPRYIFRHIIPASGNAMSILCVLFALFGRSKIVTEENKHCLRHREPSRHFDDSRKFFECRVSRSPKPFFCHDQDLWSGVLHLKFIDLAP